MRKWILLLLIVLVAGILRFAYLGSNPPSLDWDEAAWGYNSYTLGIDGRDEFGVFLPYKYIESFGDFKPPLYAYLGVIPVKVFGLNEFSTRFPSAFFGTLAVLVTYFLVKRIFRQSKYDEWYALSSAAILAISPWHINLSRAAFEANVAMFFITLGLYLFLLGIDKKPWCLIASAFSFVLTFYTFNTPRVAVPILGLVLILFFFRRLRRVMLQTICAGLLALVFLLPLVTFLLSSQAKLRYQEVNIFSDVSIVRMSNQEIANDHNAVWSKVLHNRRVLYGIEYLKHYFDNFNPVFLFVSGDVNRRFSTQDVGEMYIWEAVTLVAGLLFLFRKREGYWYLIPLWLLIGIIPAATARETPHALRIESSLPMFQVLSAYGLVNLFFLLKKKSLLQYVIGGISLFVILFSFLTYLHGYYTHYPQEAASDWQYGYKDVVSYVKGVEGSYQHIVTTESLGRPYIYYAYYLPITPSSFRASETYYRDQFGFVHVTSIGKYSFVDQIPMTPLPNTLYIATPSEVPGASHILKRFFLPDGREQLDAYTLL